MASRMTANERSPFSLWLRVREGAPIPASSDAALDLHRRLRGPRSPFSLALTRARGGAPIPASSDADRPAPAGCAALRLLADVDISFCWNCRSQILGWTMELGRSAPMLIGFA
jgi:hypothetical protein